MDELDLITTASVWGVLVIFEVFVCVCAYMSYWPCGPAVCLVQVVIEWNPPSPPLPLNYPKEEQS